MLWLTGGHPFDSGYYVSSTTQCLTSVMHRMVRTKPGHYEYISFVSESSESVVSPESNQSRTGSHDSSVMSREVTISMHVKEQCRQ